MYSNQMTKTELNKSVEKNLDYVREWYKNNQFFSTMLIIDFLKEGKAGAVVALIGDEDVMNNRHKIIFDLGIRIAIQKFRGDIDSIEAIYMMSEAWTSAPIKKGEKYTYGRPSLDPNRKEAIISTGLSEDGMNAFSIFEIKRSMNLEDNTMKVEFVPHESLKKEKKKDDKIEVESPLLKCFWDGVKLMDILFKDLPEQFVSHVKSMPVDSFLNMIVSKIEEAKSKKQ